MLDRETSSVAPLLVRLYDTHRLYALAKDRREPARAELAAVVLDMFQRDLSVREAELVTDVLVNLIRQAERELKMALANNLARNEKVPLRLVLHLANEDIEVAEPVLAHSPVLNDLDLVYIIQSHGPEYWRAIARRAALTDAIMNMLADTHEQGTAITLMQNKNVRLPEHAIGVFGHMAAESDNVAACLIEREELPRDVVARIYRVVGSGIKEAIVKKFPDVEREVDRALEDVLVEIAGTPSESYLPGPDAVASARQAAAKGRLGVPLMMETLRRADISLFVAQFSIYASLSHGIVCDILRQRHGQGLAVVCRALRLEKADFLVIYLLTQRVRKADRIAAQKDISRVLAYYDRIKEKVAQRILRNSQLH